MTTVPAGRPGRGEPDDPDTLRGERDRLRSRVIEAERLAESLADELATARDRIVELEVAAVAPRPVDPQGTRAVMILVLAAVAVVTAMVAVLTVLNSGSPVFAVITAVLTAVLGYSAWRLR